MINQDPRGVEALAYFADSDTAAVAFDDIQAALPRDILSEFGKRGNATQAATRDAISAVAESFGLPPPKFSVGVAGVSQFDAATAGLRCAARAKAGASRDAQAEAVAALDVALERAGVVDRRRHEDRDPKKPRLSFDAQLAHDAAVIQLVADAYANRGGDGATRDAVRVVAGSLGLPPPKFPRVAGVSELEAATAGLRRAAIDEAGPSRDAQEEAVAALGAALEGAGVEDPSRREDRDLKKPLLSFDAQCARDAATMQLVADAYANRRTGGGGAAARGAARAATLDAIPNSLAHLPLRRGKWTLEEQNFSEVLIQAFLAGLVPDCADGTTLRAFLSRRLHCEPMRISKKFQGTQLGNYSVFSRTGQLAAGDAANLRRLESLFVRAEIPTPRPDRADAPRAADGNAQPAARPARPARPAPAPQRRSTRLASRTRASSPTIDDAPPFGVRAAEVDALLLSTPPPPARGVGAAAGPESAVPDEGLEASIVDGEWPSSPPLPPFLAEADVNGWLASLAVPSPPRAVAASVAVEGARASPTSVTAWCGIP